MRDLPDSGQTSPSSSWVLRRPLLGTASTCLYRISSSSWASRQGLLKFVPCKGIHLGLWQCFTNQLYPFVNIPPWIYPNSNGLRHQHHQQPILPDLEQVRKASDRSCRCCRFVSVFHSLWPLVERTRNLGEGRQGRCSGSADFDHHGIMMSVPACIKMESQTRDDMGRRILVIWGSSHCCLISPTHLGFEPGKL